MTSVWVYRLPKISWRWVLTYMFDSATPTTPLLVPRLPLTQVFMTFIYSPVTVSISYLLVNCDIQTNQVLVLLHWKKDVWENTATLRFQEVDYEVRYQEDSLHCMHGRQWYHVRWHLCSIDFQVGYLEKLPTDRSSVICSQFILHIL